MAGSWTSFCARARNINRFQNNGLRGFLVNSSTAQRRRIRSQVTPCRYQELRKVGGKREKKQKHKESERKKGNMKGIRRTELFRERLRGKLRNAGAIAETFVLFET